MIYLTADEMKHKESYLPGYGRKLTEYYRVRKSLSDYYWSIIDGHLASNMMVLDIGAGKKSMLSLFVGRGITAVGLDVCHEALKSNEFLSYRVVGDAQRLPFKAGAFDFIVSQWLLEHLPSPQFFFKEACRCLRKGGSFAVVSNSLLCPLMLFNAVMPGKLRDGIKRKLLPKEVEEDTFPTFYRANTQRRLRRLVRSTELKEKFFIYASDLSFFIFNRILFAFWLVVDRLTEKKFLGPLRMHFLGVYEK
jgi:SAM-dependent methyltransferase